MVDRDDAGTPYATRVRASSRALGWHTLSVRAVDAAGQAASSAITARVYDDGDGRRWSLGSTKLTSADNGDGAIRLYGRTAPGVTVRVGLTPCGNSGGDVVDRFDMTADDRGRLDMTYAGGDLCIVELRRGG